MQPRIHKLSAVDRDPQRLSETSVKSLGTRMLRSSQFGSGRVTHTGQEQFPGASSQSSRRGTADLPHVACRQPPNRAFRPPPADTFPARECRRPVSAWLQRLRFRPVQNPVENFARLAFQVARSVVEFFFEHGMRVGRDFQRGKDRQFAPRVSASQIARRSARRSGGSFRRGPDGGRPTFRRWKAQRRPESCESAAWSDGSLAGIIMLKRPARGQHAVRRPSREETSESPGLS